MSSPPQAISETTVLLGDSRPASQSSRSLSPETLLIPVALATRLAAQLPSTTLIELLRTVVCRFWIAHGDHTTLPVGLPTSELCDAPEVLRYFATATAILAAMEGILSIVGCGILSRISSSYGRKPAFLLVLATGIIGSCMIPGSQYTPDWLTGWVFLIGMLLELFSGSLPYTYLTNMYIVDVCAPDDRTAALSKISGWAMLGTCISFAFGGFVTTKTGNPVIVFYMATAIYAVTFIHVFSFLPESFPEEKRNALSHMDPEPRVDGLPMSTLFAVLRVFEPLKMLMPTRRLDGTRNWRLAWCAAHIFVFMLANAYAGTAWVILAVSKYHLTPADTGIFLSVSTIGATIVLTVIMPPLVRLSRPHYHRRSLPPAGDIVQEVEPGISDRLDVHLAFVSCAIVAVFFLSAAAAKTSGMVIFSGICIGFASVHAPTIRSLVAGSVDPLKQGEALAAIEIVSNVGTFLSPIVMGSILSATIGTRPLLLFYVHLVVVLVSGTLLFLIRDEDRYHKPHGAGRESDR